MTDCLEFPASYAQERMWFLQRLDPAATAYSMPSALRLRGPLDLAVLRASVEQVVARHELLRTSFRDDRGHLLQVVADEAVLDFSTADLSAQVLDRDLTPVLDRARAEAARPFDLTRPPLLRIVVLRLGYDDHVALFTMHHIISDAWSVGVLMREVTAIYQALLASGPPDLPELPIQYADYAVWQRDWMRGEVHQRQLAYWREQLAGLPAEVMPPTDRPRGARTSHRGARHRIRLNDELTTRLRTLGEEAGGSLFSALTAGLTALLHRYTGEPDIVVGTPIANRNRVELENLIGFLANTLTLRVDAGGEPGFCELLRRAATTCVDAYEHQDLPFDALVEAIHPQRSLNRHPLFGVMVVLQSADTHWPELAGLRVEPLEVSDGTAKFDLLLEAVPDGTALTVDFEYRTDLYDARTIEGLADSFVTLLTAATADPDRPITRIPLVSAGRDDAPVDAITRVDRQVVGQAECHPLAIAIRTAAASVTYRDLVERADALGAQLRAAGVRPGTVVAVAPAEPVRLASALLAVLRADASYLLLDSDGELGGCRPAALVTADAVTALADAGPPAETGVACWRVVAGKAHPVGHAVLSRWVAWLAREFGERRAVRDEVADDVVLWWPLATGGRIADDADVLHTTPSALAELNPGQWRLIICPSGGLSRDLVDQSYGTYMCPLIGYYAPADADGLVLAQQARPGHGWPRLPAGRPVGHVQPVVVDRVGQPVPAGVWGSLDANGVRARLRHDGALELAQETERAEQTAEPPPAPEREATATEQRVRDVWRALLGRQEIGLDDGFFELGGHSLLAGQLTARLRELFEVDLPIRAVFEHPTVSRLAAVVDEATAPEDQVTAVPLRAERHGEVTRFPLSFNQERLWFIDRLAPGTSAYTVVAGAWLIGWLDEEALRAALEAVIARHESLRTTFSDELGGPEQVVRAEATVPWEVVDSEAHEEVVRAHVARPFDLAGGPLIRPLLVRVGPLRRLLVLAVHHIVCDGWSLGVLLAELTEEYAARLAGRPAELPALPVQYPDFAAWQRANLTATALAGQLGHWRRQLSGLVPLALPTDRPRPPVQSFRGTTHAFTVPPEVAAGVADLAARTGTSVFMVTLAAFQALLGRWCRQRDVAVGVPVAGRNRPELESLIGFFTNTLVLRSRWEQSTTFRALLDQVRQVSLDAQANQDVPFEQLVDELVVERDPSRTPLFQVAFAVDNTPMPQAVVPDLVLRPHQMDGEGARFDLTMFLRPSAETITGELEFNTDLFDAETVTRFIGWYLRVLVAAVADPERDVFELPPVTSEELADLASANSSAELPEASVHRLIEEQAQRTPDATAVVFGDRSLTYRELDVQADRLARELRARGIGAEVVVAIHAERSLELVVALLAVLKAGGAYLPVDTDLPAARVEYLLEDARPALVLADRDLATSVPVLPLAGVLALDGDVAEPVATSPDHLMYVIYTSGSTGRPKGACNAHRAVVNRLLWMQRRYGLTRDDAVLQKTPLGFDVSVWELCWPLLAGARLVLAPPDGHRDPEHLATVIAEHGVTTLHFVPSMLSAFLEASDLARRCASVRRVVCSGEALPKDLERRFRRTLGAELHNLYGPTEAAIEVTAWKCPPDDERDFVPIGRPIDNVTVHVLDDALRPVPPGLTGEIHLGGVSVCRGYLGRPALTAERFVPDPHSSRPGARLYRTGDLGRVLPDGSIAYQGRIDDQVKLRGVRIELGEIEAVLGEHPAVRAAAVTVRPGEPALVAYAVPDAAAAHPVRTWLRWERDGTADELHLHRLPNGLPVVGHRASADGFAYDEIFLRREYLRHGVRLPEDAMVFDVGANVGMFTLFVHHERPGARIWAFEPMPATHELLLRNAELHGIDVRAPRCALGASSGEATFTYYPDVSIVSGRSADAERDRAAAVAHPRSQDGDEALADQVAAESLRSEQVKAPVRTLSEIIRADGIDRIDLLKIGVERGELAILAGLTAEDWPKVRQVVTEVHDTEGRVAHVRDLLTGFGFQVVTEHAGGEPHLVYAVRSDGGDAWSGAVPRTWSDPDALRAELRAHLAERLPEAMVPSALVLLPELPVSASGKLDRAALPEPSLESDRDGTAVPPGDDLEMLLVLEFEALLGRRGIGVTDDFFALGGHSLLAARLAARVHASTGQTIPLRAFFQGATARRLAGLLREDQNDGAGLVPLVRGERDEPALVVIHPAGGDLLGYRDLVDRVADGRPVYGLRAPEPREPDVRALAGHYLDLLAQSGAQRPWHLVGWSFGGVVAYEMARQAGADIGALVLLDAHLLTGEVPTDAELFAAFCGELGLPGPTDTDTDIDRALAELASAVALRTAEARRRWEVYRANLTALYRYEPLPHPKTTVLVRPTDAVETGSTGRWTALLAGGLTVAQVLGNHDSMVGTPECAQIVQAAVARAESTGSKGAER